MINNQKSLGLLCAIAVAAMPIVTVVVIALALVVALMFGNPSEGIAGAGTKDSFERAVNGFSDWMITVSPLIGTLTSIAIVLTANNIKAKTRVIGATTLGIALLACSFIIIKHVFNR